MLHKDHLYTQNTHHENKSKNDILARAGSVVTMSEAEYLKITEDEHETGTGNKIVGEEGHPFFCCWLCAYIVKFFCYEKIRGDVIKR